MWCGFSYGWYIWGECMLVEVELFYLNEWSFLVFVGFLCEGLQGLVGQVFFFYESINFYWLLDEGIKVCQGGFCFQGGVVGFRGSRIFVVVFQVLCCVIFVVRVFLGRLGQVGEVEVYLLWQVGVGVSGSSGFGFGWGFWFLVFGVDGFRVDWEMLGQF